MCRMYQSTQLGALSLTDAPDRRQCIRSHIRMVMEQLEEVLIELKDVARELREVQHTHAHSTHTHLWALSGASNTA